MLLIAGFILSLLGSLPPGLISLSVAQTAIQRGIVAALALAIGAAFAEFFQALAAVLLSDWFLSHPSIEAGFQWVAIVVFLGLGVYLIFWAKAPSIPTVAAEISIREQFGKGILISVFNLLAIPYWFTYCSWLRVEGWWQEGLFNTCLFSLGVTIGTIFALSLYAWLGMVIVQHSSSLTKQANRFIGIIFLSLSVKSLLDILHVF
jgi:threonine/homoserine/homoserine lactone efflux protein